MMSVNGRGRAVAIPAFVCTALIAAGASLAQLQPEDPLAPVIGRLPQSTALVIVSPRPAHVLEQLKGPWKKLGPLASGLASPALEGWELFTKELGYGPQEGFDALTSGGMAIVIGPPQSVPGDGHAAVKIGDGEGAGIKAAIEDEPHWAVASVVKAATAANLRQRLRASPHGVVGGVPVLSVEDGRFALVCRPLSNQDGADELLVLAPMDDRGFFDSVVAAVEPPKAMDGAAAAPTLSAAPAFALAQKTKADVLILAAERADHAVAADWTRGKVIGCTLAPKSWVLEGASASAPGKARDEGHLPAEASAWFDQWSSRAAVMVVGAGFREMAEAIEAAAPPEARGSFGPLQRLKGVEAAGVFVGPPLAQPGAKDGAAPSGLSVWAALRARERRMLENSELDTVGCAVADAFERGLRSVFTGRMNDDAQKPDAPNPATFAALPTGASRVVTVKLSPGDVLSGNATDMVPGTVTWVRTPVGGRAGAPSDPDWSVMGVEPVGDLELVAERQRLLASLLNSPPPAGPAISKDWVWRGVVRPRVVLRSLPMPIGFALGVAGAGSVGEVRFEAWNEGGEQRSRIIVDWDENDAKP